jgi:DNA-binding LacI/PurR family transcriptional regulator
MTTASVREVARRAGVSIGTVSNVLNRPEIVAPATRQRVLDAIAELGFVRNESARALRAGRSRTVESAQNWHMAQVCGAKNTTRPAYCQHEVRHPPCWQP